jgi:formylmethanofuran dehydrogenase subunit E
MKAQEILTTEEWKKAVDFHGHVCPGLAIGFKAARAGLDRLKETRSMDEEIVAIVETDACSADAVQVLTGCTFGKGNFVYKDLGKQVFALVSRKTGNGVRVALRPGILGHDDRHMELIEKMRNDTAGKEVRREFWEIQQEKSLGILDMVDGDLFAVEDVQIDLPSKAKIERSEICRQCGEPTMASKLVESDDGRLLCGSCNL